MESDLLENYSTTHIPLAAFLKMNGVKIIRVESDGRQGVFHFSIVPRQYIIGFNNGKAQVEPNEFATIMSNLTHTAKRVVSERN